MNTIVPCKAHYRCKVKLTVTHKNILEYLYSVVGGELYWI